MFKTEWCSDDCRVRNAPSEDAPRVSTALPDQVNPGSAPTLNVMGSQLGILTVHLS
jgi:hypothetical protein